MKSQVEINSIFVELTNRYNRISVSTIKNVLKGKMKVRHAAKNFNTAQGETPRIEDAEAAFLKYTCAIFTAFRGGNTLEENIQRNSRLKADMDEQGLDYRPVNGCYREADWEYANIEYCYFVINKGNLPDNEFFLKTYSLSEKYEQDSFLYKRAGINRTAFLVATNDAGRQEFNDNIHFAGQLFLHVPDVEAWTDCSDGRFAFQLKGMILVGTGNRKIKIGEGNIFDVDSYKADGIIVIRKDSQKGLGENCRQNADNILIVQHVFKKENQTEESIERVVLDCLNKLLKKKCKCIGFHCSATINGFSVAAAKVAYDTVIAWTNRNAKKLDSVVIADLYGDYGKVIN